MSELIKVKQQGEARCEGGSVLRRLFSPLDILRERKMKGKGALTLVV